MMEIDLKSKFTSVNFELVLSNYWAASFEETNIEFNLSRLEWIAIEQITFLISWINKLVNQNKRVSVSVLLPSSEDILTTDPIFKRRQKCVDYLLIDWKLLGLLDSKVQIFSGDINSTRKAKRNIPYHEVEIIPYDAATFDNDFFELYETAFSSFINYIEKEIKESTLLNYFDNHFLHYSIIKEFYSNTCQHAYPDSNNKKCFFSLDSNNKIDDKKFYGDVLKQKLAERYTERPQEEQAFFKNNKGEYINTSFIEFNFLDFGEGIVNTLKEKYEKEKIELLYDKLSPNHYKQNEDTRILEYAFLLFTSKYELGKDFEMHDFIPRGLFIIKDIVKRYGGMIIARSKKGKVIFKWNSFNTIDEVVFRENDNDLVIGEGFPGTSITIILPSKEKEKPTHYKRTFKEVAKTLPTPQIINLLSFTNKILSSKIVTTQKSEAEKRTKFLEEFFRTICNDLLNYKSPNGDLVLFDFAGVERTNQDIFNKFIYFLAYCPLISDKINVCLFNVIEKGIGQALLMGENEKKKSKGFFIKPIPCVYPDMTVNWIGITEPDLERRVNEVWKGNTSKNETFSDIHHLAGNFIRIIFEENGRTEFAIQVQSFYSIMELIYKHHVSFVKNEMTEKSIDFKELKNEDHNYNNVLNIKYETDKDGNKKQRAFLTSNGKYQKEFLTFIEKLYIREYRRLISTYFLFNFCFDNSNDKDEKEAKAVTKVLTVTLSSQLLGKEFTEIINELGFTKDRVSLIPLSNYYDFNTEEQFNEIHNGEKIIVVNDVISTGNLSRKITKSVKEKKASIASIIAIIDSRTDDERKILIDSKITALYERPIEKFQENPFETSPIWINPILNAPTTMSREKSNNESILKSPQEFINFFKDDKLFKIGHFQQNTRHLTYYLQTDDFFREEQRVGFPIISEIFDSLKKQIASEKNHSLESDLFEIRRIFKVYNAQNLIAQYRSKQSEKKHKTISKSFKEIEELLIDQLAKYQQYSIYEQEADQFVDFIFYPFISPISAIEKNLNPISQSLRGNHTIEIYPIPRIMTPRGWRFSFPPKFLNFHTKDKSALILDDGSCTGETIIQMIDSLSFLELSEIFVLSIFGRLEDFQREFLSRIKQVRVKDKNKVYKTIPVSVFFGTHFHIPVYNINTHPSRAELKEMDEIENLYKEKENALPTHLKNYIERRKSQILKPVNPRDSENQFTLIPKNVQRRLMFVVRDIIGNFDSYRLFKEDEIGFNETVQSGQILSSFKDILSRPQGKNALIAVLMVEPYLVDTIKRIYPEILSDEKEKNNLSDFIKSELNKNFKVLGYEYLQFYLVGLYTVNYESYYDFEFLISLFEKNEELNTEGIHVLNYIGYFFSTILFKTRKIFSEESYYNAKLILQKIYHQINDSGFHQKKYASLIKELYNESLIVLDDFPSSKDVKLIFKIRHYYQRQVSNHDGKTYSSHPNYYAAFESIINRLGVYLDKAPSQKDKDDLFKDLLELADKTNKRLFIDLKPVLNFLEPFYLNYDFGIEIPEYIKLLNEFERLQNSLTNEEKFKAETLSSKSIPQLLAWIEKFNEKFFLLKSDLPDFFIKNKTNLLQLVKNTIKEHENLKRDCNISLEIPENITLELHPYLMRLVFYELLENKFKFARAVNASIKYSENEKGIIILYSQAGAFEDDINENGLITIRNIISRYGGITSSITKPSYEFEIKFLKEIKIN
jgi:hypothetical protein